METNAGVVDLNIVDSNDLDGMTEEERVTFFKNIAESKHKYINEMLARSFGDVKKTAEFVETLHSLVKCHLVDISGVPHIPNFTDLLYNMCLYSACALERLSYGKPYRVMWTDPARFEPQLDCTYLVALTCGYICHAKVNVMDQMLMDLTLNDVIVQVPRDRLLAINTNITTGEDFLRGVPRINYKALERIEVTVSPANVEDSYITIGKGVPVAKVQTSKNKAKRLRKKD